MKVVAQGGNSDNGYTDCSVQGRGDVPRAVMPSSSHTLLRYCPLVSISTPQSRAARHAFHTPPVRFLLNAESELCQLRASPWPEASTTSWPRRSPFPSARTF